MTAIDPFEALGHALAVVIRQTVHEAFAATRPADLDEGTQLLAIPSAAARLGIGQTTLKKAIAAGQIRTCLVGRRRLVPVAAIVEYASALPGGPRAPGTSPETSEPLR
jgi:excisionase family DNA binding protein